MSKLCFVVSVVPDDDGDDVVEAALLAAVGTGGPAQAPVMAASAVAQSGMDQYRFDRNYHCQPNA